MHNSSAGKTYEVSWDSLTDENVAVTYEGVAEDGQKVFFTTPIQMTGEDHDSSIDLYMWSEATNSVSLISVGAGAGNSDSCTPELRTRTFQEGGTEISWTKKCGVEVVPFRPTHCSAKQCEKQVANPGGYGSHQQPIDSSIAADTGEIYFYSPEILESGHGVPRLAKPVRLSQRLTPVRGEVQSVQTDHPDQCLQRRQHMRGSSPPAG